MRALASHGRIDVIEDLRELANGSSLEADICLIGAGAAGITLARELGQSSKRVCLVEGGGLQFEYLESQALYEGDSVGVPVALTGGRLRYLGGTTNHWGGRCAPLAPIDFRRRDWVPHSGWPIEPGELEPYYRRAQAAAGFAAPWDEDAQVFSNLKAALPSLNATLIAPFLWRFAKGMRDAPVWRWAEAYAPLLRASENIRVLLHANFLGFTTDRERTRVLKLAVGSPQGIAASIRADNFVLCCGGIENSRLLLLAAEQNPGGFGSRYDLVGRYFMQHPRGAAGLVVNAQGMARAQEQFNVLPAADGMQIEVGLCLAEQSQEQEKLLNGSAVLQYQGDPNSGVTAAQDIWRALLEGRWAPDLGQKVSRVAADFGAFAQGLERRLKSGHSLALEGSAGIPSRSAIILMDLEQAPNPQSRISLSQSRDALGLRRVTADWRLGELERRTAARFMTFIAAEFARLGIGRCRMDAWLQSDDVPLSSALNETYHYIGTTRMADDPREGVVDRHCAVHGMANLYVAGSSVFPTAGQANPTLTLVALAIRLADRLRGVT